jgi:hypothetical protein
MTYNRQKEFHLFVFVFDQILEFTYSSFFCICFILFKGTRRIHETLRQQGTRRERLSGTGEQKGVMFGELTGQVKNVASDAPLGGNGKCTFTYK